MESGALLKRNIDKKISTPHLSNAGGGSLLTGVFRHVSTSYFRRITFGRLRKSEDPKFLAGNRKTLRDYRETGEMLGDSQSVKHRVHADNLPLTSPKPNLVILIRMSHVSSLDSAGISEGFTGNSPRFYGVAEKRYAAGNWAASSKRGGEKWDWIPLELAHWTHSFPVIIKYHITV